MWEMTLGHREARRALKAGVEPDSAPTIPNAALKEWLRHLTKSSPPHHPRGGNGRASDEETAIGAAVCP
jgi:hypothetical protein